MKRHILWLLIAFSAILNVIKAQDAADDELEKGWTKLNSEYATAIYAARVSDLPTNFNRTNVAEDILGGNAPAEIRFQVTLTDKCYNLQ